MFVILVISIVLTFAFPLIIKKIEDINEEDSRDSAFSQSSIEDQFGSQTNSLPSELAENFNPSLNTPVFSIIEADSNRKTLKLKMVFPKSYKKEEFESLIACEENDIKVVKEEKEIGFGAEDFFEAIRDTSEDLRLFSGLCSDHSCKEVSKNCKLFIL